MFWFWSSYLAATLVTQVTLTSLARVIRSFLSIGRLAAGPAARLCRQTLAPKGSNPYWSKPALSTRRFCRNNQKRKPLFIVTEDFEYMVISLARKKWKKRLAFIERNCTATIKLCSLSRRDDGELKWSEQGNMRTASLEACPESGALIGSIQSGMLVMSANQTSLLSLGARASECQDLKISKKQPSSVRFDATSCACHIGNDALAAIGHTSQALALYRNRHNSWNLVNTSLPFQTINSQLVYNAGFLYHIGGRLCDTGLLSDSLVKLRLPPLNLPLNVRLQELQCAEWYKCASLPECRERSVAMSIGSAIVIFGGVNSEGKALSSVSIYDINQDVWSIGAPFNHGRFDASCITMGNYVVILNGLNSEGRPVAAIEAIHITNLLAPINGGECSNLEEAEIDDDPWLSLGNRSDNVNCRVALLSDTIGQPVEKMSCSGHELGKTPAGRMAPSRSTDIIRPVLLTSDSEGLEDMPKADDPISWFYA